MNFIISFYFLQNPIYSNSPIKTLSTVSRSSNVHNPYLFCMWQLDFFYFPVFLCGTIPFRNKPNNVLFGSLHPADSSIPGLHCNRGKGKPTQKLRIRSLNITSFWWFSNVCWERCSIWICLKRFINSLKIALQNQKLLFVCGEEFFFKTVILERSQWTNSHTHSWELIYIWPLFTRNVRETTKFSSFQINVFSLLLVYRVVSNRQNTKTMMFTPHITKLYFLNN